MTLVETTAGFMSEVSDVVYGVKILDVQTMLKAERPAMQKTYAAQHDQTCALLDRILELFGEEFEIVADGLSLHVSIEEELAPVMHHEGPIFELKRYAFLFHVGDRLVLDMTYVGYFEEDPVEDVDPDGFRTNLIIRSIESSASASLRQMYHFVMTFATLFQMPHIYDGAALATKDLIDEVFRYLDGKPRVDEEVGFTGGRKSRISKSSLEKCRLVELVKTICIGHIDEHAVRERVGTVFTPGSSYMLRVLKFHDYVRGQLFTTYKGQEKTSTEICSLRQSEFGPVTTGLAKELPVLFTSIQDEPAISWLRSLYERGDYRRLSKYFEYFSLFKPELSDEYHLFYDRYPQHHECQTLSYVSGLLFCRMFGTLVADLLYGSGLFTHPDFRRAEPAKLQKPRRHDYDLVPERRDSEDLDVMSVKSTDDWVDDSADLQTS